MIPFTHDSSDIPGHYGHLWSLYLPDMVNIQKNDGKSPFILYKDASTKETATRLATPTSLMTLWILSGWWLTDLPL